MRKVLWLFALSATFAVSAIAQTYTPPTGTISGYYNSNVTFCGPVALDQNGNAVCSGTREGRVRRSARRRTSRVR